MEAPRDAAIGRRQERVDSVLDAYFDSAIARASTLGPGVTRLWKSLRASAHGGKRIRPGLVLAAYESLGGTDADSAARVAAAFELLHTALILHDDVIDRDFTRRGMPNLAGEYRDVAHTAGIPLPSAEHRGASAGVIAGDLALTACFAIIDRARVGDEAFDRIRALLEDAVFRSAAGELLDVEFTYTLESPSVDDVVEMERLKTSVYSFEAPLAAGAILAGASEEAVEALAGYGRQIGVAYQIVDDILGVYGDEKMTGKSTLSDLREGKRTTLIAYAATTPSWPGIAKLLGRDDLTEHQAAWIRKVLDNSGALAFAQCLARQCANAAWAYLASPALPDSVRDEFRVSVRSVLERVR